MQTVENTIYENVVFFLKIGHQVKIFRLPIQIPKKKFNDVILLYLINKITNSFFLQFTAFFHQFSSIIDFNFPHHNRLIPFTHRKDTLSYLFQSLCVVADGDGVLPFHAYPYALSLKLFTSRYIDTFAIFFFNLLFHIYI